MKYGIDLYEERVAVVSGQWPTDTAEALAESAEKWRWLARELASGKYTVIPWTGVPQCALCRLHFKNGCDGCPVKEAGHPTCDDSPYDLYTFLRDFSQNNERVPPETVVKLASVAAEAEALFLESLGPIPVSKDAVKEIGGLRARLGMLVASNSNLRDVIQNLHNRIAELEADIERMRALSFDLRKRQEERETLAKNNLELRRINDAMAEDGRRLARQAQDSEDRVTARDKEIAALKREVFNLRDENKQRIESNIHLSESVATLSNRADVAERDRKQLAVQVNRLTVEKGDLAMHNEHLTDEVNRLGVALDQLKNRPYEVSESLARRLEAAEKENDKLNDRLTRVQRIAGGVDERKS